MSSPFDGARPDDVRIVAARRQAGTPIKGFDALMAAMTLTARGRIASRDVTGFAGCGLTVIDPWA